MSVYSSTELVLYTLKFLRFQGMLANKQQMLLYLCHDRVLLHACGRRGVASTLSMRKGTHFFADMQEKSHFSAIFQSDNGSRRHISRVSVSIRARRWDIILPLITLIYTDIPCIRVHLCWSVGHYCPLITLICTDIPGIRVNPCASVGHQFSHRLH